MSLAVQQPIFLRYISETITVGNQGLAFIAISQTWRQDHHDTAVIWQLQDRRYDYRSIAAQ
jgi:hypothetical protein